MRPYAITDEIFWVGVVAWATRNFHGYSRSPLGTTYNAFLVKDEKVTLFDTVEAEHKDEFFCNVTSTLGSLDKVDYIVVNHLEPDHGGCLIEAVERMKPEKIFCSPMGERNIKSLYHHSSADWPIEVCPSGHSVSIGKRTLKFLETRMLHWPDNMVTYIPEEKMLISSDAFGQNISSSERFADEIDRGLVLHALKEYFANIVQPYSPVTLKTLDKIEELALDIQTLMPDHGLIWRGEDCKWVLDRYREFATAKPKNRALILYDTMWHSTEMMAEAVAGGLQSEGVSVKIMNAKKDHHSTIVTELFDCGALVLGSPTHNNGILPNIAGTLQYIKGLRPLNKVGGCFGSYGWSGESVKILAEWLDKIGIEKVAGDAVKVQNAPTHETFEACYAYGKEIAKALKAKIASFA
ncbi:beta-lactamase domain protein [Desulfovibrio sp. X2]|uniref:FprA family A-type flavoprotein n=1 Tax=Desulfovibrio sp. X2 TaxID=941449 RepID=UPI0003586DFA|nr:flavodoxin domain-containing protein [Desulfovibrio sp. X2]EPR44722.1 beta-lactamase domain protein [Desulfovibrio sp. X2]